MSIINPATGTRQTHPLIEEYLTHRRQDGLSEASIYTYGKVLAHLDAQLPRGLVEACWDEIRPLVYNPELRQTSKRLYRATVAGFFAWACHPADPRLNFNPMLFSTAIRVPRRRGRPVPQDQLADIFARAREPFRTWYIVCAGEGLRCIELANLDREHITEEETWVQGKGGKEAFVPTHPAVWQVVQNLPWGPIARNGAGGRASREEISERGNRHLRRLGFGHLTMHKLRHYFGTGIHRAAGGDITVARDGLRHASVATTEGYVASRDDALIAAVRALPLPL